MRESVINRMKEQKGHVGFYYKNLVTGEEGGYRESETFLAASVIKLPIFLCILKWCSEGTASLTETIKVRHEDKVPICGALTLFSGEPLVDIGTLCRLMISLSDNTATNLLIGRFGMDRFNREFADIGLSGTKLRRLLFDKDAGDRGLENEIVPEEMGMLLEKIYRREFVSPEVSRQAEEVLLMQQINHKLCGIIGDKIPVAHKTGEDDNLTNDVGLIYAKQPFVLCFAGHDTCVPEFENLIRQVTAEYLEEWNK